MKRMAAIIAASCALSLPMTALAGMDMDMDMGHGGMKMEHGGGMMSMGKVVHVGVVQGVKATFRVIDIKAKMSKMGMKETHHIMVTFTDAKTGKALSKGETKLKVIAPDRSAQTKELMGMEGGFGADFTLPKPGRYGIIAMFKLADGKVRTTKFWYTVK